MDRMPFEAVDFFRMTLHWVKFAECTDIEKTDEAVSSCSRDQVALWIPVDSVDHGFVRVSKVRRTIHNEQDVHLQRTDVFA